MSFSDISHSQTEDYIISFLFVCDNYSMLLTLLDETAFYYDLG